jgi:outer membrane lipopolysaccharide assembly protein LptE/RlpB
MRKKLTTAVAITSVLFLAACGSGSDESGDDQISKIVSATCNDLRGASSQTEAANTLSYSMQLAESIGVSNTQLGSLLSAACLDTINQAQNLP